MKPKEQLARCEVAAALVEQAQNLIRQARDEMSHVDGIGAPCRASLCHLERTTRETFYKVAAVRRHKQMQLRRVPIDQSKEQRLERPFFRNER